MSKVISTGSGYKFRRISRWIKLQPYASGEDCFFRFGGHRYRLSECPALAYPEFYDDDDGKTAYLSAYIPLTNTLAFVLEMDYDGAGYVRLYKQIDEGDDD